MLSAAVTTPLEPGSFECTAAAPVWVGFAIRVLYQGALWIATAFYCDLIMFLDRRGTLLASRFGEGKIHCEEHSIDRTYAVVLSNAALPAVIALVLHMLSVVRFSLAVRKNELQNKGKVPSQ
jgi:hypothetical protein